MTEKKVISKSVRLSREVYVMIERSPGANFSEKLESTVRFCYESLEKKAKKLAYLEEVIQRRSDQCGRYRDFEWNFEQILEQIASCSKEAEELRQRFRQCDELIREEIRNTAEYVSALIASEEDAPEEQAQNAEPGES